jgi:DNA-binding Lrp family transcriptional regulator
MIELLNADGRISNREIASEIDLTEVTVAARIRALIEKRVLGISAVFDWRAAGYLVDMWITIRVGGASVREVAREIADLARVHSVHIVFGETDIIVHAVMSDTSAAATFLAQDLRPIPGIDSVNPMMALRTSKYNVNFARMPIVRTEFSFPNPVVEMDDVDRDILSAIALDGRRSNRDIARELEVSDSTVRLRIRRLEQAGLLRISAQTDPYLTGKVDAWAYVRLEISGDQSKVVELLVKTPEVGVVAEVSDRYQLLILVIAKTRPALIDFVVNQLRTIPGVRSTQTCEIIHTQKLDYHWGRLNSS